MPSRIEPRSILKKTVSFTRDEVREYDRESWETRPILNHHETARREHQIKKLPSVSKQVQTMPTSQLKPHWSRLQRFCRGEATPEIAIAATVATVVGAAIAGPVILVVPALFVGYLVMTWAYRRYGPQPAEIIKRQQARRDLAQQYAYRAKFARAANRPEDAKIYDKIRKRLE